MANIFFFKDIASLFECLCRFGYNSISEFTLTPFNVTHAITSNCTNRVVCPPVQYPVQIIESSQDSMDDIPIAESPNWHDSDNVPLNRLVNNLTESDDIPLKKLFICETDSSQVSCPSSVKSMPIVGRKSKSERDRDSKRSQINSAKKRQNLNCAQKKSRKYTIVGKHIREKLGELILPMCLEITKIMRNIATHLKLTAQTKHLLKLQMQLLQTF